MNRHLLLFLVCSSSAFGGWSVHYVPEVKKDHYHSPEKVTMTYSRDDSGHRTLGDALTALKLQGRLEKLDFIRPHPFTESADFQAEFIAAFKQLAPKEWEAAEKSAGNMHNPKIFPLWKYSSNAFMRTSLAGEISKDLEPFGLYISEFGHEKLRYEQVDGQRMIRGIFHIKISTKREEAQAGTGNPVTLPMVEPEGSDNPQPEPEGRAR